MIYLVLDAYILNVKPRYYRFLFLSLILLGLFVAFVLLAMSIHMLFAIGSIISLLAFVAVLAIHEFTKRQKVDGRYNNYNEDLNKLKNILNSFSLSSSARCDEGTWYNQDRIKYLIKMCDSIVNVNKQEKQNNLVPLKTGIIGIVGFSSGVIAEKASIEISLALAFIAIMIIIAYCVLEEVCKLINLFLFKSNSMEEIMNLKSSLMDLLIRDFPDSADLKFDINETV